MPRGPDSGPGDVPHPTPLEGTERDRALELDRMLGEERRAAMARVASSVSHALGTPLNVISGRASMIGMREMTRQELADNARIINEQVRSIADMLDRVLSFARQGWPGPEPTDLDGLARRVAELLRPLAEARGLGLELSALEPIHARVHGPRIEQVLVNLVTAAMRAAEPGARVSLSLARAELSPPAQERGRAPGGPSARFDVSLPGVALPAPDYDRVYEPWLLPAGRGIEERESALLYAISFGIAREHLGWVEVHVDPDTGSTLSLCWPLQADA